jgi:hypothetical protein
MPDSKSNSSSSDESMHRPGAYMVGEPSARPLAPSTEAVAIDIEQQKDGFVSAE